MRSRSGIDIGRTLGMAPSATVLNFPAPTRAILQPSLHARGARPFAFWGNLDDWHAPGIISRKGETHAAVDAAWLVEPGLGKPWRSPPFWPGVAGAAERARTLAAEAKLYGYQQDGAAWLAERDYAFLIDEMGLGKTPQALLAAEARLSLGITPAETAVVLVLAPALAKRHWQREISRWTGHDAEILEGLRPEALPSARYVICNYDILHGARRRDDAGVMHDAPELCGWGKTLAGKFLIVICDEAHMVRGRNSQRTKALRKVCQGVPVVWLLTGTPMPNYVRDLWAQIDLVTGGLIGSYWDFARKFCGAHQAKYGYVDTGADNLEELRARLGFYMLGRSKAGVQLELPEKRREIFRVDVHLTAPTVAAAHDALTRQRVVANALRATAKAKQSVIVAMAVEALQARQKVIVFTYMREQASKIAEAIREGFDTTILCVHGDLSPEGRDKQATTFRQISAPACFVATIDSVGVAISLVGADLVIYADLVPEPHKLLQSEARAHRHGSTCRVLVRYVVGIGTIDEAVAEAVISKLAVIEETLGREPDARGLSELLGEDPNTTAKIVDGLFEKLRGAHA